MTSFKELDIPPPQRIEYRGHVLLVTDSFQELPEVGQVVFLTCALAEHPDVKGTDFLALDATTDQKRECLAALADRLIERLEQRS